MPAVQIPQFNFMDLGRTLGQVEAIKGARVRNEAAGLELEAQKDRDRRRKAADQIRAMYEGMPAQIEQLERQGLFREADELRTSYVTTKKNTIEMIEGLRNGINKDNWKAFRSDMIQSSSMRADMLPTEYSDSWFREQIKKEKGDLKMVTRQYTGADGRVMSEDVMFQDGEIRDDLMGDPYESSQNRNARTGTGSDGKPWQMKPADSNSIRAAAASLYNGMWDPATGQYSGLNRQQAAEVAAVATEASRIYREAGGKISHNEATTRAARKLGIEVKDLSNNPDDPAGIR